MRGIREGGPLLFQLEKKKEGFLERLGKGRKGTKGGILNGEIVNED